MNAEYNLYKNIKVELLKTDNISYGIEVVTFQHLLSLMKERNPPFIELG